MSHPCEASEMALPRPPSFQVSNACLELGDSRLASYSLSLISVGLSPEVLDLSHRLLQPCVGVRPLFFQVSNACLEPRNLLFVLHSLFLVLVGLSPEVLDLECELGDLLFVLCTLSLVLAGLCLKGLDLKRRFLDVIGCIPQDDRCYRHRDKRVQDSTAASTVLMLLDPYQKVLKRLPARGSHTLSSK